jgi:ATP synthase protein I
VNKKGNPWQLFAMIGTLGMEVVLLAVGGAWLGRLLDSAWQTKPIMLTVGILVGIVLGFVSAAYTLKAFLKE